MILLFIIGKVEIPLVLFPDEEKNPRVEGKNSRLAGEVSSGNFSPGSFLPSFWWFPVTLNSTQGEIVIAVRIFFPCVVFSGSGRKQFRYFLARKFFP